MFFFLCVREAKSLVRLRGCTGPSDHSLLAWVFKDVYSLCVREAKALVRLRGCAGSSEH